jgi:hypothetical protein
MTVAGRTDGAWMGANGWRVLVQPNGLLAIFSLVTDEVLAVNLSEEDVAARVAAEERACATIRAAGLAERMMAEAREAPRTRWDRTVTMLLESCGRTYVNDLLKRCA